MLGVDEVAMVDYFRKAFHQRLRLIPAGCAGDIVGVHSCGEGLSVSEKLAEYTSSAESCRPGADVVIER
jgi:hypothetical protein